MPATGISDQAVATLWSQAAKEAEAFWPYRLQTDITVAQVKALRAAPGVRVYGDPQDRGVFVCRPGFLPELPPTDATNPPGGKAIELVIWYVVPGLDEPTYRTVITGLFDMWLRDEIKRGEFTYGFGCMPENMPEKSARWLNDLAKLWTMKTTRYEDQMGNKWLRFYGVIREDVLKDLPAPVAVIPK